MSNTKFAGSQSKKRTIAQLVEGVNRSSGVERLPWAWLLVIAPGRLVTFVSPHPLAEVERRLYAQFHQVKPMSAHQIAIDLPNARTERRFFAWIESDQDGQTRLIGQTRTPYRTAATRLCIGIVLGGM